MKANTILLVEDNPDDEELTLIAFKHCKLFNEVVVAHDGVEALDYMFCTGKFKDRELSNFPKIILLDLKIPKISGLEVLRILREDPRTKLVPIIILTSSNEVEDIKSSYRFGANSYVRKQVEFESFTNTMKQLGTYWLTINQTVTHS